MKLYRHTPLNLLILFTLFTVTTYSQKLPSVQIIQDSIKSSFRGLSVPTDSVIWVSGSNGTVGKSLDAGQTWKWMIVPGYEKKDFRDIEAFDAETAVIMAVDNPAYILKTKDGGTSWKVVFEKEQEGMFLDAMDFKDATGICIGDPLIHSDGKKRFFYLHSDDYGDTWTEGEYSLSAKDNEAIFAASGTNVSVLNKKQSVFITGGATSRLIFIYRNKKKGKAYLVPIIQGQTSTGAFSMWRDGKKKFYISGGDYKEFWKDSCNITYSSNGGKTWHCSFSLGYRSSLIKTDKETFIACGTNGVDISFDGCKKWKPIFRGFGKPEGFNVCAKSKTGKAVYFAGTGRIAKLIP
jgi:photosystem II stability/assembly factor-like uncharacterized protein